MAALRITTVCGKCGEKVEITCTGTPTLQQTEDGWNVVIPAEGWDWDMHRMQHTQEAIG